MKEVSKEKKTGVKGIISKIWSVFVTLVLIVFLALTVLLVGVRIVGYTPYVVLTGSMTPTYNPGDLVYIRATDAEKIEVGDAITYVKDEALTVVTHRVVAISQSEDGTIRFTTKGDANSEADAKTVLAANVLGVVRFSIPKLGYVSNFLNTGNGTLIAIVAILLVLVLTYIPDVIRAILKASEEPEQEDLLLEGEIEAAEVVQSEAIEDAQSEAIEDARSEAVEVARSEAIEEMQNVMLEDSKTAESEIKEAETAEKAEV